MAMISAYRMKSTLPIQQVVTKKKTAVENSMAGPISFMDTTGAIYIHIDSNFGQLRISSQSHNPTPAFTFDCPGAANDHFTREGISAVLFCVTQLYYPWRRCSNQL